MSRLPNVTVVLRLSDTAAEALGRPIRGQGGFQTALRKVQATRKSGALELTVEDVDHLVKLATGYRSGGFQGRLREALADLEGLAAALKPLGKTKKVG